MCTNRRLGQKGQALLEYLLLALISIILIGGFVYQFSDAFRVYSQKYFVGPDSYLACMIREGILPGDDSGTSDCSQPKFNLADGKKLDSSVGASATSSSDKSSGKSSGGGGSSSSGAGRASESSRGNNVPISGADGKLSAAAGKGKGAGGKGPAANTGSDGFSSSSVVYGSGDSASMSKKSRTRRVPFTSLDGDTGDHSKAQNIPANEHDLRPARMIAAEKAAKKRQAEEDAQNSFSVGNIFRWIVIAGILFSLIFFLGSAFLAVARGGKKRE